MLMLDALTLTQGAFRLSADLTLPAGGITALIGPSGAGKSTLLAAVAGFIAPEKGRILWSDTDLTHRSPAERPVSIIFQDNNLFPHLDIRTNVILGRTTARRPESAVRAAADAALARVGLEDMGTRRPAALSGGQQSRAALARVLLSERPLLLLDEPFSALGPALRRDMLALTRSLADAEAKTVLMVTHDPEDARRFSDRIVFVDDGTAHPPRPTAEMFADPPDAFARYIGT